MRFGLKSKMAVGGLVALALSWLSMPAALAWGPDDRATFTMQEPAHYATFNSITDNALVGDERQFVRIVEDGKGETYSNDLTIEPDKRYRVYIYYHNDASETFNTLDKNQVGVAKETRLMSSFPDELKKNERQAIVGRISSTTTNPAAVWDEAYVTAKEALTLHYVQGTAKIYNHWHQDGLLLSTRLFSSEGTYIGTADMNGIVYGCDKFSGSVAYIIETKAVETTEPDPTPTEPEQPDQPVTPEVPKELPKTGPIEIILAVVVVGAVIAGIIYWNKTHKAVKKATSKAKGKRK